MVKIMLLIGCAYPSGAMRCFNCSCSSLASLGTSKGRPVHKQLYALHSYAILQGNVMQHTKCVLYRALVKISPSEGKIPSILDEFYLFLDSSYHQLDELPLHIAENSCGCHIKVILWREARSNW